MFSLRTNGRGSQFDLYNLVSFTFPKNAFRFYPSNSFKSLLKMYRKYRMNGPTEVVKNHNDCQRCPWVSKVQLPYGQQPIKLLKLQGRQEWEIETQASCSQGRQDCALNQPLKHRLHAKIPRDLFLSNSWKQQAPPPAAANPLHAPTEASTHIKHTVLSLMCCSSEGERQAD